MEPVPSCRVDEPQTARSARRGGSHAYQHTHHISGRFLILYLINLLPIDGRANQIIRVIVIILGVISLLKYIAVF